MLNVIFLVLALGLIYRFVRTGGGPMLKMMGAAPDSENQHGHHEHHDAM